MLDFLTNPHLYISAYWGNREETIDGCIGKLRTYIELLSTVKPPIGNEFATLLTIVDFERIMTYLNEQELSRGGSRGKIGYSLWLPDSVFEWKTFGRMSVHAGSTASSPDVRLPNNVIYRFPQSHPWDNIMTDTSIIEQIISCTVNAWKPMWVVVTSRSCRDKLSPGMETQPFLGWLTWLPINSSLLPLLPAPCRVSSMQSGSLIVTTEYLPDCDTEEDLALLMSVNSSLLEGGIIGNADYT